MLKKLLRLFGYEINDSLLRMHIMDTTHAPWIYRIQTNGQIRHYQYQLYTIDN